VVTYGIESIQEEVHEDRHAIQRIPDDELMDLHLLLIDSEARVKFMGDKDDPYFCDAVCKEVKRRLITSGLFWKRWRDKTSYRKWRIHSQLAEIISAQSWVDELEQELEL